MSFESVQWVAWIQAVVMVTELTCSNAMKRKKMLAYLRNCSNKNFGRNDIKLYFAVLK